MLPAEIEPIESHLPLYSMLDHYNTCGYFKDFVIFEIKEDGKLYYQLIRDDADVRLLIDVDGNACLSIGGVSTTFPVSFMPAGGSTGIYWIDLTGDGRPEFIYEECWGGTGFNPINCMIFDGVTAEQLTIADFTENVEEAFSDIAEVQVSGIEGCVENGELLAHSVVMLPDTGIQQYFGEATGRLIWNAKTRRFEVSGPMKIEIY